MKLSDNEAEEIDDLREYRANSRRFMSKDEQDRLLYLIKKMQHNTCPNIHCIGYSTENELEYECPFCKTLLSKTITP